MPLRRPRFSIRFLMIVAAIVALAITARQKCRHISENRLAVARKYAADEAFFKGQAPSHRMVLAYLQSLRAVDLAEFRPEWGAARPWTSMDARALIAEAEAEQGVPIISSTDARAAIERQIARHREEDKVNLARKTAEHKDTIERESREIQGAIDLETQAMQSDATEAAYFGQLKAKYQKAANLPWLPVGPDPPEPEPTSLTRSLRSELGLMMSYHRRFNGFAPPPSPGSIRQRLRMARGRASNP